MKTFIECWTGIAAALFSQALAGEPELVESLPKPLREGALGFSATLAGDVEGNISFALDASVLDAPLLGEGVDQRAGWKELLRETLDAAAGEWLANTGKKCDVVKFEEAAMVDQVSQTFQLRSGDREWTILVRDELRTTGASEASVKQDGERAAATPALRPGLELLLDVELEASLRFGAREMTLGEILDLGPGDVVELDRQVDDPVDLIVGDKIVARGEVVLVDGNFGLRMTEVAVPKKRLESIRCLF
jgi:flagellar motor switch protein FliN